MRSSNITDAEEVNAIACFLDAAIICAVQDFLPHISPDNQRRVRRALTNGTIWESVDDLAAIGTSAFQFAWAAEPNTQRAVPDFNTASVAAFSAALAILREVMVEEGTLASRPDGPRGPCLENVAIIGLANAVGDARDEWATWLNAAARYGPKFAHHPIEYPSITRSTVIVGRWTETDGENEGE